MEMTTRKGIPYIWAGRLTATLSRIEQGGAGGDDDDPAPDTAGTGGPLRDELITVRIFAPQNNWVMRNAAVKTHAAREHMFKKAIISEEDRGAYGKTIRYCLESNMESYVDPVKGLGRDPLTGGTWDHSQLFFEPEVDFDGDGSNDGTYIKLSGGHAGESAQNNYQTICLPQAYLASRGTMEDDTNEETTQKPFSVLNKLLTYDTVDTNDEVVKLAKDEQDNPPYDISDGTTSDFNSLIEIGRLQFNAAVGSTASCYIEVPFGIFMTETQILNGMAEQNGAPLDYDLSLDTTFTLMKVGEM